MIFVVKAEAQPESGSPFTWGASYTGDAVANLSGGIKTGATYMGLAYLSMGFDTQKAGWWRGGELYVKGGNSHGGQASTYLIGDFQRASNIEAGNHTFLYELWYRQQLGRVSFTIGLQDLNVDYANSRNGALFNNSYFGIHSVCSENVPAPVYPFTALAVNLHWQISDAWHWRTAIFDGCPGGFDQSPYNVKWSLSRNQGYLAFAEVDWMKSFVKGLNGSYKLGGYYYHSPFNDVAHNYGFYFIADQDVTRQLSLFTQIGFSPKQYNNHFFCVGGGVTLQNFSSKRPDDTMGLAANHACFRHNPCGHETAIEAIYHFQMTKEISLSPDLQYIIHPAGTDRYLNNALVAMLRIGVEF
ncbi:MAG: carbohydrate porin [Mediterranea sp.]|jgi:porin|nr:carbohydrate porin [Mediterranea sp.]